MSFLVSCGAKNHTGVSATASLPKTELSRFSGSFCKKAPTSLESLGYRTEGELSDFFKNNNVEFVTSITPEHQVQFAYELKHFPEGLLKYLVQDNVTIRIMEGKGVGEDPTFPQNTSTPDGRIWNTVPGSGESPTRIVVNRLYEGHGSFNLVLHEHGHTLDFNGLGEGKLSSLKKWRDIMEKDTNLMKVLQEYCGDYCTKSPIEAFAETMAIYFGCDESRELLKDSPLAVEYMRELERFKP